MKDKTKKISCVLLAVLTGIFSFFTLIFAFFMICDAQAIASARVTPSYEKIDLTPYFQKNELSNEDYRTLYYQTGLNRTAIDSVWGNPDKILSFQDALFFDGEVTQYQIAFTTGHDMTNLIAPIVDLQDGDVLITSSCHTVGWRNGHTAIVVDGNYRQTLESYTLGEPSNFGSSLWFRSSSNFMVLRLKDATREHRAEIAAWAKEKLYNVPYSITVGIFSKKDQGENPTHTHCSHLVWQAYKRFGYDIDSDGGPVVTTRDIANCNQFEVLQVYGFDLDELWH